MMAGAFRSKALRFGDAGGAAAEPPRNRGPVLQAIALKESLGPDFGEIELRSWFRLSVRSSGDVLNIWVLWMRDKLF